MANDTVKEVFDKRKQRVNKLGHIESLPQAERWKEIKKLMLDLHPDLREADRYFCEDVARTRNEQLFKDTGASKSGDTRQLISLPDFLYQAFRVADPDFEPTQTSKDPNVVKKLYYKLWEVFPEYRVAIKR